MGSVPLHDLFGPPRRDPLMIGDPSVETSERYQLVPLSGFSVVVDVDGPHTVSIEKPEKVLGDVGAGRRLGTKWKCIDPRFDEHMAVLTTIQ